MHTQINTQTAPNTTTNQVSAVRYLDSTQYALLLGGQEIELWVHANGTTEIHECSRPEAAQVPHCVHYQRYLDSSVYTIKLDEWEGTIFLCDDGSCFVNDDFPLPAQVEVTHKAPFLDSTQYILNLDGREVEIYLHNEGIGGFLADIRTPLPRVD